MLRKKRDKSAVEPNTEPKRRTKTNKLDQELNNALSLVPKEEAKEIEGIQHQGTKNLLEHHAKSKEIDLEPVKKISIDKHVESTRYKIAYVVDKLADELMREASKKTKRDKEYMKGLTWSFGTLYDKLSCVSTDAQMVALPSKLLANVTEMLKAQAELIKAASPVNRDGIKSPVDITAQTELLKASAQQASAQQASALSSQPHGQDPIDVTPAEHSVRSSPQVQQDTSEDYVLPSEASAEGDEHQGSTSSHVGSHGDSTSPSVVSTSEKLRT